MRTRNPIEIVVNHNNKKFAVEILFLWLEESYSWVAGKLYEREKWLLGYPCVCSANTVALTNAFTLMLS